VNVSEGRRADVIERIALRIRATAGVRLLDVSSDPSHHRTVFTMAGTAEGLFDAVLSLTDAAVAAIDLRLHRGVHPRLGAVDVIPFIPIGDTPMETAVALARRVGQAIGERFGIPVFLYEEAATVPHRRALEAIRRGEFETLAERMRDPQWAPDFGPRAPHPTAGATVVGARPFLIAYNVNLATADVAVARWIAGRVRERDGGLPRVKALGLSLSDRLTQVSMNLTDYRVTGIRAAYDRVEREAAERGVRVLESELIGLAPAAALDAAIAKAVRLRDFSEERILERRIEAMVDGQA